MSKTRAPSPNEASRVVSESTFFRLVVIERDGRELACRRLTARGQSDALAIARMHAEAHALAALRRRSAPKLEIAGEDDSGPFTLYEWIPGQLLAEYTRIAVAPDALVRIALACFSALAEIHDATDERGALAIVHGDVRPENIVIGDDASVPSRLRATFVDFGFARSRDCSPQTGGAFAGSIQYAAPEAARGAPSGQPEDVFALAMCILHVIGNAPPRKGTTFTALLSEAAEEAPRVPTETPHEALVNAIHACFSMDPASRPRAVNIVHALSLLA